MAQSFNTSLPQIIAKYARALNLAITKTSLLNTLQSNPYYPSLLSVSETFDKFKIENAGFKIAKEDFDKLTPPFLAYYFTPNAGKDFVLITKIEKSSITFISESKKKISIPKEEFYNNWNGIVFLANADENNSEDKYFEKLKEEKKLQYKKKALYAASIILLVITVLGFFQYALLTIATATIFLIKLFGLFVAIILLSYEVDKSTSIVKDICTGNKKLNCDAVINSNAAKIFGISWSEVGLFYFAASFLFLLLPGISFADKIPYLGITSSLASGYIFFSVYYQWRIVKQWCPLCLTVLSVLLMELIWGITNFWNISTALTFNIQHVSFITIAILSPIVVWYSIKPLIYKTKETADYEFAYKRLLYNPEIFKGLLQQQQVAPNGWQNLGINIGDHNAKTTIIKVCNPYCGPCAKAHPILEEIIKHNPNVNLRIIFSVSNEEYDKQASTIVKHLLAIAEKGDGQQIQSALDTWYNADKKIYEHFIVKYPITFLLEGQGEIAINQMNKWCKDAEITHTPTIFINNHRLPETYSIDELKNIL